MTKNKRGKYKRKPMSQEQRAKIGFAHEGSKSSKWKGNKVGYRGLHLWIQNHYGNPPTCEHCQRTGLKGRKIHWATKSIPYSRNRENWLRLCGKCHRLYDKSNNLTNRS